ncbi:hypothetical protein [Streptomyces sp. NPDC005017]
MAGAALAVLGIGVAAVAYAVDRREGAVAGGRGPLVAGSARQEPERVAG